MKKEKTFLILPILGMLAFAALGVGLLLWPGSVLAVFSVLVGAVLLGVGAQAIAHTLVLWQRVIQPEYKLLRGIVNIVVGIVLIAKNDISLAFLAILVGLYILVMAGIDFSSAIQRAKDKKPWSSALAGGLYRAVLGLLLLLAPFSERTSHLWARVLGIYFILAAGNALFVLLKDDKPPAKKEIESDTTEEK